MDAATGRRLRSTVAALAVLVLAACGAPARVRTLDGEPDLAPVQPAAVPRGFSASVTEELRRLLAACRAIDARVGTQLPDVAPEPDVTHLGLIDGQCEWIGRTDPGARAPGVPELVVGILATPGGAEALDQTTTVLKGERPIAGVGERAVLDLQTRTLYVVKNGRLWYLQLVGSAPGVAAPAILTTLGRELVRTPSAR